MKKIILTIVAFLLFASGSLLQAADVSSGDSAVERREDTKNIKSGKSARMNNALNDNNGELSDDVIYANGKKRCVRKGGTFYEYPGGSYACIYKAAFVVEGDGEKIKGGDLDEKRANRSKKKDCLEGGGVWATNSLGSFCYRTLSIEKKEGTPDLNLWGPSNYPKSWEDATAQVLKEHSKSAGSFITCANGMVVPVSLGCGFAETVDDILAKHAKDGNENRTWVLEENKQGVSFVGSGNDWIELQSFLKSDKDRIWDLETNKQAIYFQKSGGPWEYTPIDNIKMETDGDRKNIFAKFKSADGPGDKWIEILSYANCKGCSVGPFSTKSFGDHIKKIEIEMMVADGSFITCENGMSVPVSLGCGGIGNIDTAVRTDNDTPDLNIWIDHSRDVKSNDDSSDISIYIHDKSSRADTPDLNIWIDHSRDVKNNNGIDCSGHSADTPVEGCSDYSTSAVDHNSSRSNRSTAILKGDGDNLKAFAEELVNKAPTDGVDDDCNDNTCGDERNGRNPQTGKEVEIVKREIEQKIEEIEDKIRDILRARGMSNDDIDAVLRKRPGRVKYGDITLKK